MRPPVLIALETMKRAVIEGYDQPVGWDYFSFSDARSGEGGEKTAKSLSEAWNGVVAKSASMSVSSVSTGRSEGSSAGLSDWISDRR